ncbi:hypothetical protein PAMC26577_29010 [Caballeronia sordidicola]|uniref:Uncharacterized protein n=1 Tax=Caballeronia sordidicola TaxID=196367 RepID=A0A242MEN2_CABSO|nr:hypothetical protein PAMC26577_29010 [Caballeronia sordidicola]
MYDECHCRFELEEKPRCAPCNAPRTARGSRIATEARLERESGRNLDRCDRRLKRDDETRTPRAQGSLTRKMRFQRLKTRLLDGKAA